MEQIVWKNKYNAGALTKGFSNIHEYILAFSKSPVQSILAPLTDEAIAEYKGQDDKYPIRGGFVTQPLATGSKDTRPNLKISNNLARQRNLAREAMDLVASASKQRLQTMKSS